MRVKIDANGKVSVSWFDRLVLHVAYWVVGLPPLVFKRYKPRPYDPSWLVGLAQEQMPDETWLHAALARCTQASGDLPCIYFVDPRRPNMRGAEWQFDTCISLEDTERGELILDVLKDGRIGGVEFLGVLLGQTKSRQT